MRKHMLASCASIILSVGLFCSMRGATAATEITVGRLHEIDLVRLMQDIVPDYQGSHPEVTIKVLDSEFEQDLTTYQSAIGPLPDIFAVVVWTTKKVHELPYCVRNNLIVPVEELGGDNFMQTSGHFNSLWRCIEYKGKHWGVPFYAESYGVLMKNADVPLAAIQSPPKTWAELKRVTADSTKDANGDGKPDVWGVALDTDDDLAGFWFLLSAQLGAKLWDGERFTIAGNSALIQAFRMIADLRDSKSLAPHVSHVHALGYVQNWQFIDEIERTSGYPPQYWSRTTAYTVIPFPSVGRAASLPVLNIYLAVKKTTPEKQAACWDFVRYATSAQVLAAKSVYKMGYLPIHESVASSPEFQERVAKMPHLAVFVNTLRDAVPFFPYVERGNEALETLAGQYLKALGGEIRIEEALSTADEKMNALVKSR